MSFDHALAEPRKTYLNNLINLFFQTGINLIQLGNFTLGLKGIRAMLLIVPAQPKEAIESLRNKTKEYMTREVFEEELYQLFEEVGSVLNENYFSELQLGIIPTSTLEGQKPKPEKTPIQPGASSRI